MDASIVFEEIVHESKKQYSKEELYMDLKNECFQFAEERNTSYARAQVMLIKSGKVFQNLLKSDYAMLSSMCTEKLDLTTTFSNIKNKVDDECSICYSLGNGFRSLLCNHEFCTNCWKSIVEMNISERNLLIHCPNVNDRNESCDYCLTKDQIKTILKEDDQGLYGKYKSLLLDDYIRRGFKAEVCPKCGEYLKLTPGSISVKCKCSHRFCTECKASPHEPVRCDLVDAILRGNNISIQDDLESLKYICSQTRYCPRCRTPVQKTEGCKFMICSCKAFFCFDCLLPLTSNHQSHACVNTNNVHIANSTLQTLMKQEESVKKISQTREQFAAYDAQFEKIIENKKKMENIAVELRNLYASDITKEEADLLRKCFDGLVDVFSFLSYSCLWLEFVSEEKNLDSFYLSNCNLVFTNLKKKFESILHNGVPQNRSWLPEIRNGATLLEKQLSNLRKHFKQEY